LYLKKSRQKNGRVHLSIATGYYDKKTGKTKTVNVKTLGYLDVLEKQYSDPISYFSEEVRKMNELRSSEKTPVIFNVRLNEKLVSGMDTRKNFGYACLSKIYHELGIHTFLINRQRHSKEGYNANAIMQLLVFSRLLFPSSKKKTFENRSMFFENADFSLDDVYRCLSFLNKRKNELLLWMHKRIQDQYNRDTSLVYYDVTNYYFEIDEQDDLRRKGVSKEHRHDPIVQIGLFMDNNGIPITYGLYPGNILDKQTLIPVLGKIQRDFSLGRIVVVADKGITTGDNIYYTLSARNGYILSYSIRGADAAFKAYVLDEDGYIKINDEFKIKSRLYPREVAITAKGGGKKKVTADEKQLVFYSKKYAEKARAERAGALQKAKDLIKNPHKYNLATSHGAAKYVKNISFDAKTGEIMKDAKRHLLFDEEKLRQEEELDGYYAIVTSEYRMPDEQIIEIYRGLWRIEESFKITKSDFESRPVYLSAQEHIQAHFLTCFVSLVIARLLEYRIKRKYSVMTILEGLGKASCSHMQGNYYLFNYYDNLLADLGAELGIDFARKYMTLGEIKKILAEVKKDTRYSNS